MYKAIGCNSLEEFVRTGDAHVAVLRFNGLKDGMAVYDLGCGSGRTAQALQRSGWQGAYKGADIVHSLVKHVNAKCTGYEAIVNRRLTIAAEANSIDLVFHWSVFTHLFAEECYIYMVEIFRSLKPGGKLVFSFLELEDSRHVTIFDNRVENFRKAPQWSHLDTFLHRDWICSWAEKIGFTAPVFTNGSDASNHPAFWQTLVSMNKPV